MNDPKRKPDMRQVYRKEKRRKQIRRNRILFALLVLALLAVILACIGLLIQHHRNGPDGSSQSISAPVSSADGSQSVPSAPDSTVPATEEPTAQPTEAPTAQPLDLPWDTSGEMGFPYLIAVNRQTQTVTVYEKDANDNYTVPHSSMICSTGTHTPVGHFHTTDQYTWRLLEGNVYGQYATRITGHILFHSVPYYTQNKGDLEKEEFNKLGTDASLGCVRLQIEDCKWIYDECPSGTPVVIFDGDASLDPLGQPAFTPMDLSSPNAGWDPTDPDPANPWHNA